MPKKEEAEQEAEWIYQQVFNLKYTTMRQEFPELYDPTYKTEVEKEIKDVLVLMHDEKLEVGEYVREALFFCTYMLGYWHVCFAAGAMNYSRCYSLLVDLRIGRDVRMTN